MRSRSLRIFSFIAIIAIVFFANTTKTFAGTGFLGGPMWINPEVPADGDLVTLHALFHNAEPNQLSGDVLFYDGSVLLGRESTVIAPGGISTTSVTFRISAGDHIFSAITGNLVEDVGDGKTEQFALAPQTVQLPNISVPSKAGSSLNATIVPGGTVPGSNQISPNNPLAGVINQVNQAKTDIISSIPSSVTSPVVDTASSVDTWRTQNSNMLDQAIKDANAQVKSVNGLAADQQKKYGSVALSTNFVDRPFAYVKLFFFTLLAFLYSHSFVFYGIILIVAYFIGRAIWNKISPRGRKKSKSRPAQSKRARVDD